MTATKTRLTSLRAGTDCADSERAAGALYERINQPGLAAVLFFASPSMDFEGLARAMDGRFGCPTIGCTTAGEISSERGHERGTVVAASIASSRLRVHSAMLGPEDVGDPERLRRATRTLLDRREMGLTNDRCFAMVISDGLSMAEERLAAGVAATLGEIPLVGGSAGDDLAFRSTWVALNGRVGTGGAVLSVVETEHPFEIFQAHHFTPTDARLVITRADPATRRVYEINGERAATGYARAVGIEVGALSPRVFSSHPVMLKVGGNYYIRSIQQVNEDGSLTFYCAIDNGLVLRLAEGRGVTACLGEEMRRIRERIPDLSLTIGFDCVLRRLELMERGLQGEAAGLMRDANLIGFSTYGEQINGLHVNQTITGVALGNAA
ncbi:MAG: FIST C-terminal domain-containing protein [Phycisphaerales bacterium]|nr:FIST C-terminal domain-containing protein [Planctomycetota bacterium]MCH8509926.1 FIST C-terminal domain-containing protein [Phycisphaerales bacterium]